MSDQSLTVKILADPSQYERNMAKVGQNTDNIAKKLGAFGKAAVAGLAVAALGAVKAFVGDSVRAFSELEQSVGGTEAVFGDSSKAIDDFAKNSANSVGLAESEFRDATTAIGGQLKRMTGDVDFAAEQSIILTEVAADLAATYGGTTAEAVAALGSAFRGEADPAERFNLNLKQGAVNAKAVELGLAKTTGEVDENAKAQATLALIMEQSTDAQGQFGKEADTVAGKTQRLNAQLENNKALVGQALSSAYSAALPFVGDLGNALADVAIRFMELTGEMDENTAAIKRWEIENGETADTITNVAKAAAEANPEFSAGADLIDVWTGNQEKMNETFREGISQLDLTAESTRTYRNDLKLLTQQGVLTEEQEAQLIAILEEEVVAQSNAGRAAGQHRGKQDELKDATEGVTEATQTYMDKLREMVDPVFAAAKAAQRLKDEQAKLEEMQGDSAVTADELALQQLAVAEATLEAQGAVSKFDSSQLDQAIDTLATSLRISKDEAKELLRQLGLLDGKQINTYVNVYNRQHGHAGSGGVTVGHEGGIVPGPPGAEVPILAMAGETILPTHNIPGSSKAKAMMGHGGSPTINVTINAGMGSDPNAIGKKMIEYLETYYRNHGI